MSRRRRRPGGGPPEQPLEVLPGGGRRYAHIRNAAIFYIIVALFVLLLVQAGYHWMGSAILARRLQITAASEGVMERRLPVEGMLTRQEQVLRAPCSGIIVELAPEGERAAAGTVAAVLAPLEPAGWQKLREEEEENRVKTLWNQIRSYLLRVTGLESDSAEASPAVMTGELPPWLAERMELVLPRAGLLLHRLDGWEGCDEGLYLEADQYADAAKSAFTATKGIYVEADQPILKVIDNWQWFYHVLLPLKEGRIAAARENVLLEFPFAPGQPVQARVVLLEIDAGNEEVRLAYCINKQFPGFEALRRSPAELIFERSRGLIIPAGALIERGDVTGVYLSHGGRAKFSEVAVTRIQEGRAMVEGLEPGSMVIARPDLVEEGQRLE